MPLIRIQHYPGVAKSPFIASEDIAHLAVVEISPFGSQWVALGSDNVSGHIAGVAWGSQSGAVSGKVIEVVHAGVVSGVMCASSINAGDRVTAVSGGRIAAYNVITPAGVISGYVPINIGSGGHPLSGVAAEVVITGGDTPLRWVSGAASGLTGAQFSSGVFTGTAFITGRVLGKALASGTLNSGIPLLVELA